ncbi:MAG: DUF262 domain-containing protein [Desulfotignum sp.]|nr:DUF262 domain-containing protein [Desulfotignum sp.]
MKAQDLQFTQLIQGAKQFIIPIFQRTYSWEVSHCEQLWNDIVRVGSHAELDSHFIGSAVYIPERKPARPFPAGWSLTGSSVSPPSLCSCCAYAKVEKENLDEPVSAAEIEDHYLRNRYGKGELSYKMLLTKTDKDTLIALLDGTKADLENASQRIV